jgi:hypothetical protein
MHTHVFTNIFNLTLKMVATCALEIMAISSTSAWFNNTGTELALIIKHCGDFWNLKPCNAAKVKEHFRGTCSPQFQDCRTSQLRNQHEANSST